MPKYTCERCLKEFSQKSHYTKHQNKKIPCQDNKGKIEEVIENIIINKKLISNNTEFNMINNIEMSHSQQKKTDILTSNTYYVGDNIELLKNVKSNSINLIYLRLFYF